MAEIYQKLKFVSPEEESPEEDKSEKNSTDEEMESIEIEPQGGRKGSSTMKKEQLGVVTTDYYGLAQTVGGNHSCLILFMNRSNSVELRDPVIFSKTGFNRIPPDCRIPASSNAYCAFRKKSTVMKGTSGVMSYEYDRRDRRSKRFAIMWNIPYRIINREENEVAVKWLDVDLEDQIDACTHTSRELFDEMAGEEALVKDYQTLRLMAKNGKTLRIVNPDDGAELDATFSGSCKAIVKIDFSYEARS